MLQKKGYEIGKDTMNAEDRLKPQGLKGWLNKWEKKNRKIKKESIKNK